MNNAQVVCYGEVLWDILPEVQLPGGAPMNVAYHLRQLGISSQLITRIGNDKEGRKLRTYFENLGCETRLFQEDQTYPTGKVYAHIDNGQIRYEIERPSAWDFIDLNKDIFEAVENSEYFVFGSLASRNTISRSTLQELLELAKRKILDINMRSPFDKRDVLEDLMVKADGLKLNEEELNTIASWHGETKDLQAKLTVLGEVYHHEEILVTMGGEGAALYFNGELFSVKGISVEVQDTIGSGDAFLAGYLAGLIKGQSRPLALTQANLLGAFVAGQKGGCPSYNKEDFEGFKSYK